MTTRKYEDVSSARIANIVTCIEMPDDSSVSDRTQATRRIGGFNMLVHLAQGELDSSSRDEMGAFLGRVIANAERQGVVIEVPVSQA